MRSPWRFSSPGCTPAALSLRPLQMQSTLTPPCPLQTPLQQLHIPVLGTPGRSAPSGTSRGQSRGVHPSRQRRSPSSSPSCARIWEVPSSPRATTALSGLRDAQEPGRCHWQAASCAARLGARPTSRGFPSNRSAPEQRQVRFFAVLNCTGELMQQRASQ